MEWMVNLRGETWLEGPREDSWWTGLTPQQCPGFVAETQTLGSLPMLDLSSATRQEWLDYFDNTWTVSEVLYSGLHSEEPFYRPPVHGLRHPLIFYYGHTACLFVNKLRVAGVISEPVDAYLESVLETGVDEMSWDDMHKNDMVWPTVAEVQQYRRTVYGIVRELIETAPELEAGAPTIDQSSPMWAMVMGFEHDRIHTETSSVLIREMPDHLTQVPPFWPKPHSSHESSIPAPDNAMLSLPAGKVRLGKEQASTATFGWDNEYGTRDVQVPAFAASQYMTSNGEYLDFVKDGGYQYDEFWSGEGAGWRKHRNAKWPFFWRPKGPSGAHEYNLRTVFDLVDLPMSWPVDVNYHEARAYASWKQKSPEYEGPDLRLITEAEHNRLRDRAVLPGEEFEGNLNLKHGSGTPVNLYAPTESGHFDVMGNGWEWTEDHFDGLDGFKIHPYYTDFSTPCYDGKHSIIMGGSFASTGDQASHWARYSFRPHFLQHSGVRLAASESTMPVHHISEDSDQGGVYETPELLEQYMLLHYGSAEQTFQETPSTSSYPLLLPCMDA